MICVLFFRRPNSRHQYIVHCCEWSCKKSSNVIYLDMVCLYTVCVLICVTIYILVHIFFNGALIVSTVINDLYSQLETICRMILSFFIHIYTKCTIPFDTLTVLLRNTQTPNLLGGKYHV